MECQAMYAMRFMDENFDTPQDMIMKIPDTPVAVTEASPYKQRLRHVSYAH